MAIRSQPIIVLGGGLSGLSAAYYLLKKSSKPITIIEKTHRVGGWIKSLKENDIIFEQAARTIRPHGEAGANTLTLIEELGLSDSIVPILNSEPAARNRMIYVNNHLYSLPTSLTSFFKICPPFSKPLYSFLLNDLKTPKKSISADESVYDFVKRRFGEEPADYLVSPLIQGICAGNAQNISVKFLLKRLFDFEQRYGGVVKGLLRNLVGRSSTTYTPSQLSNKARNERWSVYSFKGGLEVLPKALHSSITQMNGKVVLERECTQLHFKNHSVSVGLDGTNVLHARHVVSALPAPKLANLVRGAHPKLAELLNKIQSVSVAVVNLRFDKQFIETPGFGFLTAPKDNLPLLGVIYDSCCFPTGENTVLTVMLGGHQFENFFSENKSEEFILKTALTHLKNILGVDENPSHFKVNVLENCIPQYTVGHYENVNEIKKYIKDAQLPISLCGAYYNGIGINDVIASAKKNC